MVTLASMSSPESTVGRCGDSTVLPVEFPDELGYRICAWCDRLLGFAPTKLDTHGICDECSEDLVDDHIEQEHWSEMEEAERLADQKPPLYQLLAGEKDKVTDKWLDMFFPEVGDGLEPVDQENLRHAHRICEEDGYSADSIKRATEHLAEIYSDSGLR